MATPDKSRRLGGDQMVVCLYGKFWRCGGLMVNALDWGHCVGFLGKTLYSHSASLLPGVHMGGNEFSSAVNSGGGEGRRNTAMD